MCLFLSLWRCCDCVVTLYVCFYYSLLLSKCTTQYLTTQTPQQPQLLCLAGWLCQLKLWFEIWLLLGQMTKLWFNLGCNGYDSCRVSVTTVLVPASQVTRFQITLNLTWENANIVKKNLSLSFIINREIVHRWAAVCTCNCHYGIFAYKEAPTAAPFVTTCIFRFTEVLGNDAGVTDTTEQSSQS